MISDAQRRAKRKWDAANRMQLRCEANRELAEQFKRACAENGTTVNAVLLQAVHDFLDTHPESKK